MSREAQGAFECRPVGAAMLAHLNATDLLLKEIEKAGIRVDRERMNAAYDTIAKVIDETLTARSRT
jgi:hypothetical protein